MLGLKQRRRMVRNPFMPNQSMHPYYNYQQNQFVNPQQMYPYQGGQANYVSYGNNPNQNLNFMNAQNQIPFQMPYPNQQTKPQQAQSTGFQSILNQFKTKEGGYDVNKMMDTAGQMMNTMSQLNGMFKQVGSIFKPKV
ncbi:YppG family protein [Bacillus pinisoli]|uniref:YppG family protein n=1 Tax=Bacillus pinisoli TaxID=2901866 RepID=UPI001FF23F47|nr:YppG family protein [Bacillus pinisoli]